MNQQTNCECHEVHIGKDCFGHTVQSETLEDSAGPTLNTTKGWIVADIKQNGSEFACRFHPTDWFHEVGCEHMDWSKEQLREALILAKKNVYKLVRQDYGL